MNSGKTTRNLRRTAAWAAALGLSAACAWGEVISPLYVGNLVPVRDQNGRIMAGSYRPSDAASRSRVEVRTVTGGGIVPPTADGTAATVNPLLTSNSVCGIGYGASTTNSGLFCLAIPNRPPAGTKIFARVFNAPTVAEASFYADSRLGVAQAGSKTTVVLTFGAAQPLDPGDADGDGLNNSWEKALGIDDRLTADYDGDGMSDLQEMRAGTNPKDAGALLAFRSIREESSAALRKADGAAVQTMRVSFQSVPGKSYQLEFSESFTAPEFAPVGAVVTAAEGETEIEMLAEIPADAPAGLFRVVLADAP
jgi:hypothetical protein